MVRIANDSDTIAAMQADEDLKALLGRLYYFLIKYRYSYNFTWLSRPIIQLPDDIMALSEIVWSIKPDMIVETGIAHGGSLILYASLLQLLGNEGTVVGIDLDIRTHNRVEIEKHPLNSRITMIEGSSVDPVVVSKVGQVVQGRRRVMVVLDSDHTHSHVLRELVLYSPLVKNGSYIVVCDTAIEDVPSSYLPPNLRWGKGNNPKTAVQEFLKHNKRFRLDREIADRLLITASRSGYLKCVKD